MSVASVKATAVALRGPLSISAISPKMLRSPSVSIKLVVDADFDSSAFDDEEFRRWVALSENDIACFEAAYGIARLNQKIKVDVRVGHALFLRVISIS